MMFSCTSCTALHRELRDYSLRQIAFAGFCAVIRHHTAALPCKQLLTSACKQA